MNENIRDKARDLFEQLLELPEAERESRLRERADGDSQLEERVRRLLDAHVQASEFDSVIPAPPDISLPDPEHIGPYRVLEKLGEGGMGVVYLAEQKKPVRRRVAIKIVRPGMASTEVINRFNAERQALALMSHPGISRILDAGATENGLPYFVMEYVPGVPLIHYCDEHRLNLRQRVSLVRNICLAVQHAHQKGVIHRDLKPSNVLVVEEDDVPVPKIIDFGIAKAFNQPLTDDTLHTRIGKLVGTPDYMSPEQCSPGTADIDTRSDVYSLGVLLYQLLSSQLPYNFDRTRDSEAAILQRISEEDPPPPSRRARDADNEAAAKRNLGDAYSLERRIRGELDWIVGKALERDRNRRYASAQELADDLQHYLDNEPVTASPPSIGYRAGKFIRRHMLGVSLLTMSFLLVTGSAAMLSWQLEQTRQERDRANREAEIPPTVTEFTASLFKLATPGESGANDISARDLLDLGVRRLDTDVAVTAPLVRAALLEAAGNAYIDIGNEDDAERLLLEALELYRVHGESQATGEAGVLISLARLHTLSGDWDEALRLGKGAVELSHPLPGESTSIMLRAVEQYAETLRRSGRSGEAVDFLDPYLPDIKTIRSARSEDIAAIMAAYGKSLGQLGDYDSAMTYLEKALEYYEQGHGPVSNQVINVREFMANILLRQDRAEEASEIFEATLASTIKLYGDSHRAVANSMGNLALALSHIPGKLDEAAEISRQALEMKQRFMSPEAPDLLTNKSNLALIYSRMERLEQAADLYHEVLVMRERVLGRHHASTALARSGLASVYILLGRLSEAEPLLDTALQTYTQQFGERDWRTATLYYMQGRLRMKQARYDAAEDILLFALDIFTETLGTEHSRTVAVQEKLTELQQLRGKR